MHVSTSIGMQSPFTTCTTMMTALFMMEEKKDYYSSSRINTTEEEYKQVHSINETTNDLHSTAIVLQYNKLTTVHSPRPLSLFCGGFVDGCRGREREHTGTDSAKKNITTVTTAVQYLQALRTGQGSGMHTPPSDMPPVLA